MSSVCWTLDRGLETSLGPLAVSAYYLGCSRGFSELFLLSCWFRISGSWALPRLWYLQLLSVLSFQWRHPPPYGCHPSNTLFHRFRPLYLFSSLPSPGSSLTPVCSQEVPSESWGIYEAHLCISVSWESQSV